MKTVIFALIASALAAPAWAADASACYTIADADRRAVCLAKARKDASHCYAVQDAGLRAECRAEVGR